MKVTARLFAGLRERFGSERYDAELSSGATIQHLMDSLGERSPELRPLLMKSTASIDLQYAGRDQALREGQEVAILPPVSGG